MFVDKWVSEVVKRGWSKGQAALGGVVKGSGR